MGFYVSPDDLAKYIPLFRQLSTWWQLVIVVGLTATLVFLLGWRIALGHYRERIETQKVFIDEYREKLKGLSPAEASEQIQRLEAMIARVQWRTITSEQRALFREVFPPDTRLELMKVCCVAADAEAESYANQLVRMFQESGHVYLPFGDYLEMNVPSPNLDEYPVIFLAKNMNSQNALWFKRAFDVAGVGHYFTLEGVSSSAHDEFLAIRIGPKAK